MEEHSEDIFQPFLEMAKATGGLAESSANPSSMMKKAGEASRTTTSCTTREEHGA